MWSHREPFCDGLLCINEHSRYYLAVRIDELRATVTAPYKTVAESFPHAVIARVKRNRRGSLRCIVRRSSYARQVAEPHTNGFVAL